MSAKFPRGGGGAIDPLASSLKVTGHHSVETLVSILFEVTEALCSSLRRRSHRHGQWSGTCGYCIKTKGAG